VNVEQAGAEIAELLAPGSVAGQLRAASKKQILQELARRAAPAVGLGDRRVYEALADRERAGSTGIGGGVAIPHCRLAGLSRLYGLFARLERPVPFEATDGDPVDLVFLLLAPAEAGAEHLRALSRVSRLLRDKPMCEKLRGANSADALYALLTGS
jgi:nitrogen PTS system EIIA component